MRKALTDRYVATVKPDANAAQVDIFDLGYSGLALRVGHRDKVWTFHHRLDGKLRRLKLGRYPEMTLAEARDAWLMARKGMLPVMAARPAETVALVDALISEWFLAWQRGKAANTVKSTGGHVERVIKPAWGSRAITDISRRDVMALLDSVADKARTARHVFSTLRQFFDWCLRREIIGVDPMAGLKRKDVARIKDRDRVLSDDELAKLMAYVTCRGSNHPPSFHMLATHLLVLTAARSEMIGGLRWDEVNHETISFPADRMKTKQPFELPITKEIRAVLDSIPRIADCPFVFGKRLGSWDKFKAKIDAATGLSDWQFRDIRRTVSTGMQRLGISPEVIDAVQAHAMTGIKRVYQRHAFKTEKRDALEKWGAFVHTSQQQSTKSTKQPSC